MRVNKGNTGEITVTFPKQVTDGIVSGNGITTIQRGPDLSSSSVLRTSPADRVARGKKRMLIAHSEIFPGAYASTTETADWTIRALGRRRTAVLQWGPRAMQQLGKVRHEGFRVLGFAGTTTPDHIDQLHAMPELLKRVRSR